MKTALFAVLLLSQCFTQTTWAKSHSAASEAEWLTVRLWLYFEQRPPQGSDEPGRFAIREALQSCVGVDGKRYRRKYTGWFDYATQSWVPNLGEFSDWEPDPAFAQPQ